LEMYGPLRLRSGPPLPDTSADGPSLLASLSPIPKSTGQPLAARTRGRPGECTLAATVLLEVFHRSNLNRRKVFPTRFASRSGARCYGPETSCAISPTESSSAWASRSSSEVRASGIELGEIETALGDSGVLQNVVLAQDDGSGREVASGIRGHRRKLVSIEELALSGQKLPHNAAFRFVF